MCKWKWPLPSLHLHYLIVYLDDISCIGSLCWSASPLTVTIANGIASLIRQQLWLGVTMIHKYNPSSAEEHHAGEQLHGDRSDLRKHHLWADRSSSEHWQTLQGERLVQMFKFPIWPDFKGNLCYSNIYIKCNLLHTFSSKYPNCSLRNNQRLFLALARAEEDGVHQGENLILFDEKWQCQCSDDNATQS